jgi:hypothetical protein
VGEWVTCRVQQLGEPQSLSFLHKHLVTAPSLAESLVRGTPINSLPLPLATPYNNLATHTLSRSNLDCLHYSPPSYTLCTPSHPYAHNTNTPAQYLDHPPPWPTSSPKPSMRRSMSSAMTRSTPRRLRFPTSRPAPSRPRTPNIT